MIGVFPMSCGACGCQTFEIFGDRNNYPTVLEVKCTDCKSTSVIEIIKPNMEIRFGEKSDGILCIFPQDER